MRLRVGPNLEILSVHQSLLCKSSEFFKRVLKPECAMWREDPNTIDLPDDPVDAVLLYTRWLYHEVLMELCAPEDQSDASRSFKSEKIFLSLATAYVFGETVMDPRFKNAVVLKFLEAIDVFNWLPGPTCAAIVYGGTAEGSSMRRLLSDIVACDARSHSSWVTEIKEYPRELLNDALIAMAEKRCLYEGCHYKEITTSYLKKESN